MGLRGDKAVLSIMLKAKRRDARLWDQQGLKRVMTPIAGLDYIERAARIVIGSQRVSSTDALNGDLFSN